MKKIELVLNQYTFIDFQYIWYLLKRYYITSILIILGLSSTAYYRYSLQRDIYHQTVNFQMRDDESSSPTSAIASLLGEKTSRVNHNFVLTIKQSSDLNRQLAINVRNHPDFEKLNLNSLSTKKLYTSKQLISQCKGNEKCEIKMLSNILYDIYSINEDDVISNWYHLNIKTLDSHTTTVLSNTITKTIKDYRKFVIMDHLNNQIETTDELIINKKNSMSKLDIETELLESQKLKGNIITVTKNIQNYSEEVTKLMLKLEGIEKTYFTAKEQISTILPNEDEFNLNKYNLLKIRLKLLRQDISMFDINKPLSNTEKDINNSLKEELRIKEEQFSILDLKFRNISSKKKFFNEKILSFESLKENYFIVKSQYNIATKELIALNLKKDFLLNKLLKTNKVIEIYKPDIEYLKLLKEKELKLKILKSTVVADLSFDGVTKDPFQYKRASKKKAIFFALILALFAVTIYVVIRFLFDNRVFNDAEYNSEFKDFPVIGETPKMTG